MKKALTYGIISSIFFAFTFVLNSSMNLLGGSLPTIMGFIGLFFIILGMILNSLISSKTN
ncbi:hypothetical protein JCM1393_13160 [Clostridium carnis]